MRPFPTEFLWGATLSAHAVEGGHFASDWWRWEQRPGRIADGSTSQIGSDHWNRFQEDIRLARKFGLNALLVSLEWSRIEPEPGKIDGVVLDHYRAVLETMRAEQLEPIVALHEVTLPQWIAEARGWLATDAAESFARYAAQVAEALGEACRYWIPILNPVTAVRMGHLWGHWPPGLQRLRTGWQTLRQMALAHAQAFHTLRKKVPEAEIGAGIHAERLHPFDDSSTWDLRAARCEQALSNEVWLRALTTGNWPRPFRKNPALADTVNFIGASYYGAQHVRFRPGRGTFAIRTNRSGERTIHEYESDPKGMAEVLRNLATFDKPLMILGNGIATEDDKRRRHYLLDHVAALQRALADGIDVRGYMYRSLLDGFEWDQGYTAHYGLVHVGRGALARTPNPSAYLYKDIADSGGIRKGALARYSPDWLPPDGLELA
ncbi:MAG: family 1 glycosylhydrolase [Candidatus Hydrogenedentota bacterium]